MYNPLSMLFSMLIAIVLISGIVCADVDAFQNEPEDFRGIIWGARIDEVPDMVKFIDKGNNKFYHRRNDKMNIGEARLSDVVYIFYKDQFVSSIVETKGKPNYDMIKLTLTEHFGDPVRYNKYSGECSWLGDNVYIGMKYDSIKDAGSIMFSYRQIDKQIILDDKERAKRGINDL